MNMGNSKQQVDELCRWLSANGYSQVDCAADSESGDWSKGIPNPYNQFFQGQSYLANIQPANVTDGEKTLANYQNVTFESGCRNNWHIHHGAVGSHLANYMDKRCEKHDIFFVIVKIWCAKLRNYLDSSSFFCNFAIFCKLGITAGYKL